MCMCINACAHACTLRGDARMRAPCVAFTHLSLTTCAKLAPVTSKNLSLRGAPAASPGPAGPPVTPLPTIPDMPLSFTLLLTITLLSCTAPSVLGHARRRSPANPARPPAALGARGIRAAARHACSTRALAVLPICRPASAARMFS
jgi:hypothetical protein